MNKRTLRKIIAEVFYEAKKGDKGKKLTGSAGKLRGKAREGRLNARVKTHRNLATMNGKTIKNTKTKQFLEKQSELSC